MAEGNQEIEQSLQDNPDHIINEIFRIQNERDPESDPGDLTIIIQDDTNLVEVMQRGYTLGVGGSLQEALEVSRHLLDVTDNLEN